MLLLMAAPLQWLRRQPARASAQQRPARAAAMRMCRCSVDQRGRMSRRVALGGAATLPALWSGAALARGLDRYIRTPKPAESPELLTAVVLLAREELVQFERALRNTSVEADAEDLRALLRAGPFRKFRDSMRSLARVEADRDAATRDAEACFKELELLDAVLLKFGKAEANAVPALRANAADNLGQAVVALDAMLSQLPQDTMDAARAALV